MGRTDSFLSAVAVKIKSANTKCLTEIRDHSVTKSMQKPVHKDMDIDFPGDLEFRKGSLLTFLVLLLH